MGVISAVKLVWQVFNSQNYHSKDFLLSYCLPYSGDHSVEVMLAGGHVEGSPFLIKAYDATKVKVTDINSGTVGKPVYFSSKYSLLLLLL